jgi:cell wall-associated NlpC family hydrolase
VSHRNRFVIHALEHIGDVVLWGELDCSELVCLALKEAGGPDWTKTHTAASLHDKESREIVAGEHPLPGDLTFHGFTGKADSKLHVTHVGIWMAGGKVLSADGATSKIKTLAEATKNPRCRVRLHEDVGYRPDLPYRVVRRFTALDALDKITR